MSDGLAINVFRPKNISAKPLVALLKPITNRSGHLEAFVDANAVLIADKASNITKIMNIANELDRLDQDLVELISLKNSSSKEMAKILNDLHLKSSSNRLLLNLMLLELIVLMPSCWLEIKKLRQK